MGTPPGGKPPALEPPGLPGPAESPPLDKPWPPPADIDISSELIFLAIFGPTLGVLLDMAWCC